jgi:hypothetical protein
VAALGFARGELISGLRASGVQDSLGFARDELISGARTSELTTFRSLMEEASCSDVRRSTFDGRQLTADS